MRSIYAIGETVLDIIFKNGKPEDAKPGGSMLNTAVSLGRLGSPIHLITEFTHDQVGNLIDDFLSQNNVSTRYVSYYDAGKTALALAFLDEKSDASYVFYKDYPDERLNIDLPDIQKNDIVLFGSFFSITPPVRKNLMRLLNHARQQEAIILYDPNFRRPHLKDLPEVKPFILENIQIADIIRGSDEDFACIFNAGNVEEAYGHISKDCQNLIYTASSKSVYLQTSRLQIEKKIQQIQPVSTIGAGDNFNAGLIFGFLKEKVTRDQLISGKNEINWEKILDFAITFSRQVCMTYENYIPLELAEKYKL